MNIGRKHKALQRLLAKNEPVLAEPVLNQKSFETNFISIYIVSVMKKWLKTFLQ